MATPVRHCGFLTILATTVMNHFGTSRMSRQKIRPRSGSITSSCRRRIALRLGRPMAVRQALAEWGEQQAAAASGGAPFIGAAAEGGVVDLPLPHEEAAVAQTPQMDAEVRAELWIVEAGGDIDWA